MYILENADIKLNLFNNFKIFKTVILVSVSTLLTSSESTLVSLLRLLFTIHLLLLFHAIFQLLYLI